MSFIADLDIPRLKAQFAQAQPFRHILLENFLEPAFAQRVAEDYPKYAAAAQIGREFDAVNERNKVQVTAYEDFPPEVQHLADALASEAFRGALTEITGIKDLLWDDTFSGGGMHLTASSGHLDVHVDFNRLKSANLYRRLNLLLYLNPVWHESWGGKLELWDPEVRFCAQSVQPVLNRCLVFETSETSFHGVTGVNCPIGYSRNSFAVYYYSKVAPERFDGMEHDTVFRARPHEYKKRFYSMPAERLQRVLDQGIRRVGRRVKQIVAR